MRGSQHVHRGLRIRADLVLGSPAGAALIGKNACAR
jgi:hypothetical protein